MKSGSPQSTEAGPNTRHGPKSDGNGNYVFGNRTILSKSVKQRAQHQNMSKKENQSQLKKFPDREEFDRVGFSQIQR